jgi:hypothetical protein
VTGDQTDRVAPEDDRLVGSFWEYSRLSRSDQRADRLAAEKWHWAWDAIQGRMASDRRAAAVALLVRLADAAPDDAARRHLGAGPLEELLFERHAEVLDLVDVAARRSRCFREALAGVCLAQNVPPEAAERLGRHATPRD